LNSVGKHPLRRQICRQQKIRRHQKTAKTHSKNTEHTKATNGALKTKTNLQIRCKHQQLNIPANTTTTTEVDGPPTHQIGEEAVPAPVVDGRTPATQPPPRISDANSKKNHNRTQPEKEMNNHQI
jgi:hypothetical protein